MTILLVAAAILAFWSTEQTFIAHFSHEGEKVRARARTGGNIWGVLATACLIAAALVA